MSDSISELVEQYRQLPLHRWLFLPSKWWLRSVLLNAIALLSCRLLLSGFHIRGWMNYAVAAIVIELPSILWWFAFATWNRRVTLGGDKPPSPWSPLWVAGSETLIFVAPILLATYVPGVLLAEWMTPMSIRGFWTYVSACAITAAILISLRGAEPLRRALAWIRATPKEPH
jgi:uncharacterized membrane protein YvlD (DUF360 family)